MAGGIELKGGNAEREGVWLKLGRLRAQGELFQQPGGPPTAEREGV